MLDKYDLSCLVLTVHVLMRSGRIEDALDAAGIRYERLDGTMKRDDRTRAMDALKYDPACEILLVSLKAGGVGLNLTAAQRVYLMDPYWYAFFICLLPQHTEVHDAGTRPWRTRLLIASYATSWYELAVPTTHVLPCSTAWDKHGP